MTHRDDTTLARLEVTEAMLEEIESDPLAPLLLVPEAEDAVATVVNTEPSASDVASLAIDSADEEAEASFVAADPVKAVSAVHLQSLLTSKSWIMHSLAEVDAAAQSFLRSERPVSASSELCSLVPPRVSRESHDTRERERASNTHAIFTQTIVIRLDKGGNRAQTSDIARLNARGERARLVDFRLQARGHTVRGRRRQLS